MMRETHVRNGAQDRESTANCQHLERAGRVITARSRCWALTGAGALPTPAQNKNHKAKEDWTRLKSFRQESERRDVIDIRFRNEARVK